MNGSEWYKDISNKKVIYASDLDRTLIFSQKFITDYKSIFDHDVVETSGDTIISMMARNVRHKLNEICENEKVCFIPVTTRSINQYNRVKLNAKNKIAVTSNGGVVLYKGKQLDEYRKYINDYVNQSEMNSIIREINTFKSCSRQAVIIDDSYIFFKVHSKTTYDNEVERLKTGFNEQYEFVRQKDKCYIIPRIVSKKTALKWIWEKIGKPYIVASGDSDLDLPMLLLADTAVIPTHSTIKNVSRIKDLHKVEGLSNSAVETMKIVKDKLENTV